jgi:P-type conjugative transfer ATPase TrbB
MMIDDLLLKQQLGVTIMALFEDQRVIEVMVNPDGAVWCERLGQGRISTGERLSVQAREGVVKLVASELNQEVDELRPSIDAQILQGARFHGWLGHISSGPGFVVRKRAEQLFTLEDYHSSGALPALYMEKLRGAVAARENILVVGGTGSGKTTFTNAMLHEVAKTGDRLLTVEDVPELRCATPDLVNMYTNDHYTMRRAIQDALRKRPDRIVVGEVRDGASALELLKAWNTGHPGGVATLHANSARAALGRLEDLLLEAATTPPRRLIGEAIQWIVFVVREGTARRVSELVAVREWDATAQEYRLEVYPPTS